MRWDEWAQSLWDRYGLDLIRRERDVFTWAEEAGYGTPEATAVTLLGNVPNRHALFADATSKPTFPYPRNRVLIPMSKSGRLDVSVTDYNRFEYRLENKAPKTTLRRTTLALSPFPRSSTLIVTPRYSDTPIPMWEAIAGDPILLGSRRFDSEFVTYARERDWAIATLRRELREWLLEVRDVRIMADRDTLLCIHLDGWCPTGNLDELADLAFSISRSAREASHLIAR